MVRHEPFTFERLKGKNALHLDDGQNFNTIPFRQTGLGTVTGILKHVGLARAEDIPEVGLSGRIALIQRGEILFEEKVSRVIDAGAIAAVIYNNAPRNFAGVLKSKASIPAISISQDDGERLLGMMESINLTATVSLEMQTYHSRNVVAERPGSGDGDTPSRATARSGARRRDQPTGGRRTSAQPSTLPAQGISVSSRWGR